MSKPTTVSTENDMRLAFSAMTATSGLILLALAVYGDPSDYMLQARNAWDSLLKTHPSVVRLSSGGGQSVPGRDRQPQATNAEAIARLQQEVTVLQQRLAAQAAAGRPVGTAALSDTPQQTAKQGDAPSPQDHVAGAMPLTSDMAASPPTAPQGAAPPAQPAAPAASFGALPTDGPTAGEAADASAPNKAAAHPTTTSSKPAAGRRRAGGQIEDTQSVLTRLRQNSTRLLTDAPLPVQAPLPPPASPALPRLMAARAAVAAGRIDDAVRLLQEAQLQLVFRPVDTPGGVPEAAGQGASAVAHALEALSANQSQTCQQFINQAVADLNGVHTRSSAGYVNLDPTGYAPAYPPR